MKTNNYKWAFLFLGALISFNVYAQEGVGKPGTTGMTGRTGPKAYTGPTGSTGTKGQQKKLNPGIKPDTTTRMQKTMPPDFNNSSKPK